MSFCARRTRSGPLFIMYSWQSKSLYLVDNNIFVDYITYEQVLYNVMFGSSIMI
jgi:hypothetical protein